MKNQKLNILMLLLMGFSPFALAVKITGVSIDYMEGYHAEITTHHRTKACKVKDDKGDFLELTELWKTWHKNRRLLCCNKIERNTRLFVCAPLSELKVFAADGTPLESDHLCDPQTNPNLKSKILDDSLLTRHFA